MATGTRIPLLVIVVVALVSPAGGFAAGWFARGGQSPPADGHQQGIFSLDPGEELKVFYSRRYASPPRLELNARPAVKIVEEQRDYFKVRIEPGNQVINARWEAWGAYGD